MLFRESAQRGISIAFLMLVFSLICAASSEAAGKEPALAPDNPAPAKAVIQIWLWGGPSHLDTFDPKPEAGYDYTGHLNGTIQTNVPGIEINAALPELAEHADKYSIIRSMTHGINAHETASYIMQTGRVPGEKLVYPSIGAVVSMFKGYDYGYTGDIPPYVILTTPQGRFSEVGFLESKYKPFVTGGDPNLEPFAVEGIFVEGISEERQHARRDLLKALDTLGSAMPDEPAFEIFDRGRQKAYDFLKGDAAELFDLSNESDKIRDMYGRNTFGQSCLMARRLVESGVVYVTINYRGWDTHSRHFDAMRRKLPEMDRAVAALLQDLSDTGLLDSTIVWWGGEFGRTPRINWEAPWNGGRGHHGNCFSVMVAGGGFKGGKVIGASDARGERVLERPVSPRDLLGSIYELLGIDTERVLPNPQGLDIRILPCDAGGGDGRLKEIMPAGGGGQ